MSRLNHIAQFGAASLFAVSGLFAAGLVHAERIGPGMSEQPSSRPALQTVVPVSLGDYYIAPGVTQLESGPVSFLVFNQGDKTHNFIIEGNGLVKATPDLDSGGGSVLTLDLAPGT